MPGHRCKKRIPSCLRVKVRVQIDKARGYRFSLSLNGFSALAFYLANLRDGVAIDGDIASVRRTASAIDDQAVFDYDVVSHLNFLSNSWVRLIAMRLRLVWPISHRTSV